MIDQADTVPEAYEASRTLPVPCSLRGGVARGRQAALNSGVAAQMIGAGGQGRGLKGGPPVLQAARRAYLEAEWSGRVERRARVGGLALTCI